MTEVGGRGCALIPSVCRDIGLEQTPSAHPNRNDLKTSES